MIIYPSVKRNAHAPVAQLDRVTDYESVGQGFESLPAYQKAVIPSGVAAFFVLLNKFVSKLINWIVDVERYV